MIRRTSSNPVLKRIENLRGSKSFTVDATDKMSIEGTSAKTLILLLLTSCTALYTYAQTIQGSELIGVYVGVGAIGGFILALITTFKANWSPYTAPLYALFEGLFLGSISAIFEMKFQGIVLDAVLSTFGVLLTLLLIYSMRLIRVTEKFRIGVIAATGGVALVFLVSWILSFFGISTGIYGSSMMAIGFTLVVIVIAAMNLLLDFDFIEQGSQAGLPKYMEWYGAFGLMVSLIWLYIEILRLLSQLRGRD